MMPSSDKKEIGELCAQVRGLLLDFEHLGLDEIFIQAPLGDLPPCPLGEGVTRRDDATLCRPESLAEIAEELQDCKRCRLSAQRRQVVFGIGDCRAQLVFVGEGPGREEDAKGEPFVGEAGRLLDRILFAMGLRREQVYICNVVKCRPPRNRDPQPEEIKHCEPYLKRQLAAINPRVIVALGRFAAQTLLREEAPIGHLRGHWRQYEGIDLMPTFHPAFLLRNPAMKREMWEDMKQVVKRLRQAQEQ